MWTASSGRTPVRRSAAHIIFQTVADMNGFFGPHAGFFERLMENFWTGFGSAENRGREHKFKIRVKTETRGKFEKPRIPVGNNREPFAVRF